MESEPKYTNDEVLDLCGFDKMADSMGPVPAYIRNPDFYTSRRKTLNDKTPEIFDFNEWILSIKKSKKRFSDRRWKRIYRMLYIEKIDQMPLYINSSKTYVKSIARWRMSRGK